MQDNQFQNSVDTLLAGGRTADAIALVTRQAAAGHRAALFQQGLWLLAGQPLARNVPAARGALVAAAAAGHQEARLIAAALVANGSGGGADWAAAVRIVAQGGATGDVFCRRLEALLGQMDIDGAGRPIHAPAAIPLTNDGSVRQVSALLTAEECAHIANSAVDLLAPAIVADPRTGRSIPHPIRTSDAAVLSPVREDLVIRAINARIAAATRTAVDQGEALTILRYQVGQQFRLHSDALPHVRNQRVMTALLYLNDDFAGGETTFPDHQLVVTPRRGDALIFDNTDAAGHPLARARHAGEPVRRGVKWLATRWIRARPFDVWKGPESV